jgi:2-polyprenyl-6-methoxyphenol hydroxylase-like FAD-dependent oxidoreductase
MDVNKQNDWATPGFMEDFIHPFREWHFDWLDVPQLFRDAEIILEYPMTDRDPLPRWTFGRITLLGDAAHPMYPRGGNGAAQAILDAEALARQLAQSNDTAAALMAYEHERIAFTANVVNACRTEPPDTIINRVEAITGGKPFSRIEDVIDPEELRAIEERYARTAGYDVQTANKS